MIGCESHQPDNRTGELNLWEVFRMNLTSTFRHQRSTMGFF